MITIKNNVFHIDTVNTSYIFRLNEYGHLFHLYYGAKIRVQNNYEALYEKCCKGFGNTVLYSGESGYSLDTESLEYSGIGKGDTRNSPVEIIMHDKSYVTDFVYKEHKTYKGDNKPDGMPSALGASETLEIILNDVRGAGLILYYTVYEKCDVIARRVRLINNNTVPVTVCKLMSLMLDLPDKDYAMVSFDGLSMQERYKNTRNLSQGTTVTGSLTGFSGNRSNPLVILKKQGKCYGFNLIYSGNHYESAEVSAYQKTRIMSGINPHCFNFVLNKDEYFDTPYAVMTFAPDENGLSNNFHDFVNENIVRGEYKGKARPVLVNNWEATYFDFNEPKLLKLAKSAKNIGAELFVLDDGWFGKRDDDTSGLGDWTDNIKKTGGLRKLSEKINKTGLLFGLWIEPEMVNPDSFLYKAHPDWAVRLPDIKPSLARNQLILDFTRKDVRDYITETINNLIMSAEISYIKWDMNRHMSDMYSPSLQNQGEFYHKYILGLYDVLERIINANPKVLFESCASGGNRFDLGMLCYTPQIWTSDNQDPSARVNIQGGTSYGYPQSVMGAHVSASPHHQTLRTTPLLSRFNVAAFGLLGYELDLDTLSAAETKEVQAQVEFYKKYREIFQFGKFTRLSEGNRVMWQVTSKNSETAIILDFCNTTETNPGVDIIRPVNLLSDAEYKVSVVEQRMSIKPFGSLINLALPVKIKTDGLIYKTIDNHLMLKIEDYEVTGKGDMLMNAGFKLKHQFNGSGYDENVRVLTDSGSRLYLIELVSR